MFAFFKIGDRQNLLTLCNQLARMEIMPADVMNDTSEVDSTTDHEESPVKTKAHAAKAKHNDKLACISAAKERARQIFTQSDEVNQLKKKVEELQEQLRLPGT